VILAVAFGLTAAPAHAAFSAKVKGTVLDITGNGASDQLALRLKFGELTVLEVDVGDDGTADFSFARSAFMSIEVDAGGGDDLVRIDESYGFFTDTETTSLNGAAGNDTIVGGSSSEAISGGNGDDVITASRGDDTNVRGGPGADTFVWNPGDGSDRLDGQGASDTLLFRGANIGEMIELSANGGRLRFTRNVATITMDTDDVESVDFHALGGEDVITVNDLAATDVTDVALDLAGSVGGGDGAADQVIVTGTAGNDTITVSGGPTGVSVSGLAAAVAVTNAEPALDRLTVNAVGDDQVIVGGTAGDDAFTVFGGGATAPTVAGLGAAVVVAGADPAGDTLRLNTLAGADTVSASTLLQDTIRLVEDGGAGMDTLLGSLGEDLLLGGDDDDAVSGFRDDDVAFLGAGDDTFTWNPGDGNDVVEGQDGADTLLFRGANIGEMIELSANGGRLRFTRNVATITMDTDDVESVDFHALGGEDVITVNDLAATDVTNVALDLAGSVGGGDGAADQVIVTGTNGVDTITVAGSAGSVSVTGLAAAVAIANAEPTDKLDVKTLDGDDNVDSSALAPGTIQLFVDGLPV
jgi:predicted ester cyclase